jgi:hypothetical protein
MEDECVYVLLVKKTRGMERIEMLKQPDSDGCRMFPKWFYRWLEVEPWYSDIRKHVNEVLNRKGYVVLEVRGKHNIQFGRNELGEHVLFVYDPKIVDG